MKKAPKKPQPAQEPPPSPAPKVYTLETLSELLGPPDLQLREALFMGVDEAGLVQLGAKVDSDNIVKDMPLFIGMAYDIRKGLSQPQDDRLLLTPEVLPILVAETIELKELKKQHDADKAEGAGGKAEREKEARQDIREGITLRDAVYDALRNVVGPAGMTKVDEIVGTAETGDKLAAGMEALAGFIQKRLEKASKRELMLCAAFRIDAARVKLLEDKAAKARAAGTIVVAAGRRVTQQRLDLKDGHVLNLVERVLRAYRAANRQDRFIVVPQLPTIGWLFDTGAGKKVKKKPSDPRDGGNGGG